MDKLDEQDQLELLQAIGDLVKPARTAYKAELVRRMRDREDTSGLKEIGRALRDLDFNAS
jgi:hypothetical protein